MYVKNLQMLKTMECAKNTREVASPHIGVLGERMRERKLRKSRLQLTSAGLGRAPKKKKRVATANHIGVLWGSLREQEEGARVSRNKRKPLDADD